MRFSAPPPPLGVLGATYNDHLMLIFVLIELFSLSVTAEALRANIGSKSAISLPTGPVHPKFQIEGVATPLPPTVLFFSENHAK